MKRSKLYASALLWLLPIAAGYTHAQTQAPAADPGKTSKDSASEKTYSSLFHLPFRPANQDTGPGGVFSVSRPGAPGLAAKIKGEGTPGVIAAFTGPATISNSLITQTADGVQVDGLIQTSRGIRFPDGSLQTTAASGGGGGGFSLPFAGSASTSAAAAFSVFNDGDGNGVFGAGLRGNGVVGRTSAADKAGVLGNNTVGNAVHGVSTTGNGVFGRSTSGDGVVGQSDSGIGVSGRSDSRDGVAGVSDTGNGVRGLSSSGQGVFGETAASDRAGVAGDNTGGGAGVAGRTNSSSSGRAGVVGINTGSGIGVLGTSASGIAMSGISGAATGSTSGNVGVFGHTANGTGVIGLVRDGTGVLGQSTNGIGVEGVSNNSTGAAIRAINTGGTATSRGVLGNAAIGVEGTSPNFIGVNGLSANGNGMFADSTGNFAAVFARNISGAGINSHGVSAVTRTGVAVRGESTGSGPAGQFVGNVQVTGNLSKGGGSFKIDHPLDPENKYLYHSFVESPDMMNIYNGNIVTDQYGDATVTLPDYFEALNKDFRYQLTVIGTFAQAIVANEIENNRFTIKTNGPNVKVSWQVTGIRRDAYAEKHRIKVEEDKPERERGYYLHPEAYGQPKEISVEHAREPEPVRQMRKSMIEAGASPRSLPPPGSGAVIAPRAGGNQ